MCDPVIVMSEGSVLFEGTSEEVKKNERVIESYLGRAARNTNLLLILISAVAFECM